MCDSLLTAIPPAMSHSSILSTDHLGLAVNTVIPEFLEWQGHSTMVDQVYHSNLRMIGGTCARRDMLHLAHTNTSLNSTH